MFIILKKIINFKKGTSAATTNISNNYLKKLILNLKLEIPDIDIVAKTYSYWDLIFKKYHSKYLDILLNNNEVVLKILNNPGSTDLLVRFDSNCISLKKTRHIDKYKNNLLVIDELLLFVEFLKIKRADNPVINIFY